MPNPDGSAILLFATDGGAHIASVAAPDRCILQFAAFAPGGHALVATMVCPASEPYQVRRLSRDGAPTITLATSTSAWFSHPVVSRDGKKLAISELPFTSNVYVADLQP